MDIPAPRLDHHEQPTVGLELRVRTTPRTDELRPPRLKPDQIAGMVRHAHLVGFRVTNPHLKLRYAHVALRFMAHVGDEVWRDMEIPSFPVLRAPVSSSSKPSKDGRSSGAVPRAAWERGHHDRPRSRGSSRSRRPSPTRLKPTTVTRMARPGNVAIQGAVSINDRPVASIEPHSGVGGVAPRPRNDSPAVSTMVNPTVSVAKTMIGDRTLGRTWRPRMRTAPAPTAPAASTNSCPRMPRTAPRTRRANWGV